MSRHFRPTLEPLEDRLAPTAGSSSAAFAAQQQFSFQSQSMFSFQSQFVSVSVSSESHTETHAMQALSLLGILMLLEGRASGSR